MTRRLTCLCPGCRRTIAQDRIPWAREWICGKHWRAVPAAWRKRYCRLRGRWRRRGDQKAGRLAEAMWVKCRDAAIREVLMGVTI